ncbi:MAG: HAD family phosphatase [Chloroflexi bacterium]|nr:HAD family phosphatase [Chloroflexota bacterium]
MTRDASPTIQAVIFDFGGVLITDHAAKAQLAAYDRVLGWPEGTLHARLYSGPAWEAVSTGAISLDEYWERTVGDVDALLPAHFRAFQDNFFGERLDEAVVRLAWRLRRHYRLALLSNATALLKERLEKESQLDGLFDVTVISALAGARKPDPRIYRMVCQELALPFDACVLVDDKVRNTKVARKLGMRAIEHRDAASTERALRALGLQF